MPILVGNKFQVNVFIMGKKMELEMEKEYSFCMYHDIIYS